MILIVLKKVAGLAHIYVTHSFLQQQLVLQRQISRQINGHIHNVLMIPASQQLSQNEMEFFIKTMNYIILVQFFLFV